MNESHKKIDHIASHWNEIVINTSALAGELEAFSKENEAFVDFYLEAKSLYEHLSSRFESITVIHQKLREMAGPVEIPEAEESAPLPAGATFH